MDIHYWAYGMILLFFAAVITDTFLHGCGCVGCGLSRKTLQLISAVSALLLIGSDAVAGTRGDGMPVADILTAAMIIMFCPTYSVVSSRVILSFSIATGTLSIIVAGIRILTAFGCIHYLYYESLTYFPAVIMIIMFIYVVMRTGYFPLDGEKRKSMRYDMAPVPSMYLICFAVLLFLAHCSGLSCWDARKGYFAVLVVLSLAFYVVQYIALTRMKDMLYPYRKSRSLQVQGPPVSGESRDIAKTSMKELFAKITDLFVNERPYLDGDITVKDVAQRLFTNRAYISRAINEFTGRNFCQYVNYYRVMHSVELFRENPHLRVSELAELSGFHTQVSYSMAFRLIMNENPGEWCRKTRSEQDRIVRKAMENTCVGSSE